MSDTPSVLESVDENATAKILDRDPTTWKDGEIDELVDYLRKARVNWQQEELAAKASGKRPRVAKGASKASLDEGEKKSLLDDLI